MKLFNLLKRQKSKFITKELVSLSSLAQVPTLDYFKDNKQFLLLMNLKKQEYLEILIKEKVLTSNELKAKELHRRLDLIHRLIEQNTLGDELFEKVFFTEEDKVKALIKIRKFAIYQEKIKELEEEIVSRIIALKEILNRTFLNKRKRISIINEINNLTNIFIILMNQKETLRLCLNNYGLKCFDIYKKRDSDKEKKLITKRKEELNAYQKIAFGQIIQELNNLTNMAQVEIALEEYVYNCNWENSALRDEIIYACNNIEADIDNQVKDFDSLLIKIIALENKYKIFYEFGKNIINKEDLKRIYRLKFKYFTTWRLENAHYLLIEPFVNEEMSTLELDTYKERIFELINDLSDSYTIYQTFEEYSIVIIRLLKKELQTDGKYDALEILKNKYKLNLLRAFSYPGAVTVIEEIYKLIYVKRSDYPEVNFYETQFIWNGSLPLETINELKIIQNQIKELGLYLFLKNFFGDDNDIYSLPEGLNKIGSLSSVYTNGIFDKMKQRNKFGEYVDVIRKNAAGKIVILPKSLISVIGDIFGDTEIAELRLNEGLEYFNFNYLRNANIKKIVISATVKPLIRDYNQPNNENLKEMEFIDFDKSCYFNNLNNLWTLLSPYIKVADKDYSLDGTYSNINELTIDSLVFNFSDSLLYPISIEIQKQNNPAIYYNHSRLKIIEIINNLIMQEIEKYQRDTRKLKKEKVN